MQKIDLDAFSIEDLAKLRDQASAKLAEKVAARRKELEDELDRLSVYGKSQKAAPAQPKLVKEPKEPMKEIKDARAA